MSAFMLVISTPIETYTLISGKTARLRPIIDFSDLGSILRFGGMGVANYTTQAKGSHWAISAKNTLSKPMHTV